MTTVFLDLDGTLIDPKPGITRSIRYALLEMDRETPGEDALDWCIGPPLWDSFRKLGLAEAELDRAGPAYWRLRRVSDPDTRRASLDLACQSPA